MISRRRLIAAAALWPIAPVAFAQSKPPTCGQVTPRQTEGPFFKTSTPQRITLIEPASKAPKLFVAGQVLARDRIHRRARAVLLVAEIEKCSDLIDRKAKIACPANEAEPVEVLGSVGSIIAAGSCGRRKQSDTLVVADCLHLGLRCLAEIADPENS